MRNRVRAVVGAVFVSLVLAGGTHVAATSTVTTPHGTVDIRADGEAIPACPNCMEDDNSQS